MEQGTHSSREPNTWILSYISWAVNDLIGSNFLWKTIINQFGVAKPVAQYIPELVYIIGLNERGMQILKETKIYDLLMSQQNKYYKQQSNNLSSKLNGQ